MPPLPESLIQMIATEARAPIPPSISAIAEAARARHGQGIAAVLGYGSCLREGDDRGKVVDLYLLPDDYRSIYDNPLMRVANALLPPNVFYLETPFEDRIVRCKYAIVSLEDLERLVRPQTFHPYFWARFAQPTAIVWARDEKAEKRVVTVLAQSASTVIGEAAPFLPPDVEPKDFWIRAFSETYRTELRAERPGRAIHLYETHAARYDRIIETLREASGDKALYGERGPGLGKRNEGRWRRRRYLGKVLSVLRLMKSAFTFHDGPVYLMWKIEQHSGVKVTLTPWQRRHPILASPTLFWRLYRKGAFR